MRSLDGKILGITRNEQDSREFSRLVSLEGGHAISLPTIEIVSKGEHAAREFLDKLRGRRYDYCAFMSPQAVSIVFKMRSSKEIADALESTEVIAIGPKTRVDLEERGVKVKLVPESFSSEGIVSLLSGMLPKGKQIIVPRSSMANDYLRSSLEALGMHVDEILLYSVRPCRVSPIWHYFSLLLQQRQVNGMIFTSASAVEAFFDIMSKVLPGVQLDELTKVISIGPYTSKQLENRKIKNYEARQHTVIGALELARELA